MERIPSFRKYFVHKMKRFINKQKSFYDFISHHHHVIRQFSTFPKNFYLFCEQAHDGGDDVVVIMYANVRCDDHGCGRLKDENKVRRVDRAQHEGREDYLHSQGQTHHLKGEGLLGC